MQDLINTNNKESTARDTCITCIYNFCKLVTFMIVRKFPNNTVLTNVMYVRKCNRINQHQINICASNSTLNVLHMMTCRPGIQAHIRVHTHACKRTHALHSYIISLYLYTFIVNNVLKVQSLYTQSQRVCYVIP